MEFLVSYDLLVSIYIERRKLARLVRQQQVLNSTLLSVFIVFSVWSDLGCRVLIEIKFMRDVFEETIVGMEKVVSDKQGGYL